MVTVSAPGKVHLIGEHAVVYGEPAIIAAVGKRSTVEAKEYSGIHFDIHGKYTYDFSLEEINQFYNEIKNLWDECRRKGDFSTLFSAFKKDWVNYYKMMVATAFEKLDIEEGIFLNVKTELPIGAGLGSSSSLSVSIAKAISEVYGRKSSPETINDIAFRMEQFTHGMPSGGDNSTCCFGGMIWFKKGNPNTIQPLKEVSYRLENIVLVNTGSPAKTTGELVQIVKNLDPSVRDPVVKEIGNGTRKMLEALKKKDFEKIKNLVNLTQKNLKQLGISTPGIDRLTEKIRSIGGAAKLCGAGGGGVVLCMHNDKNKMITAIKELNYEPLDAELGVEGVRIEHG